ncbi:MAG: thiamine pyrophosphate-dependent enzyme [Candidatus Micrarchaeaceae archaeon]
MTDSTTPPAAKPKQSLVSGVKPIWCPGCVLGDTLVVSNPSVKQIQEVKAGDKVLTANGEYKLVAATVKHHHEGKMYRIKVKFFGTISATPEHPFVGVKRVRSGKLNDSLLKIDKIEAAQLRKGDYLVFPIMKEVKDISQMPLMYEKKEKDTRSKELPPSIKVDDDFLRLAGYYIAEGCVHNRSIDFSFNKDETEHIDDVRKLMGKIFGLEGKLRSRKDNDGIEVLFNSSYLGEVFISLFGDSALNKNIPHSFMFLPLDKQQALLRGMWRGDGYFDESKAGYATISVVLAEQLKMLLLRQGIVPTVCTEPAHGMHKKAYRIYVSRCDSYNSLARIVGMPFQRTNSGKNSSSIIKEGKVYLPISRIETFDFDGPVYDLTMASDDHTFVTNVTASGNCGDFSVEAGLMKAVNDLGIEKEKIVIVSGIGCSSSMPHPFSTYGIHSLHGRLLPVANGVKLANDDLTVIGTGGDGDGYGIGVGHLIHSARRNIDITYIVMNNEIYGLTTGQASPTSLIGSKTKSTPFGSIENPENPVGIAIAAGATYVARAFSGDPMHMAELIKNGITHKGFSIIDVFSPCVTFNNVNTYDWFRQRVYKLEQAGHDPTNLISAMEKSVETEKTNWEKVPIGLFYKVDRPTYSNLDMTLQKGALVKQPMPTKQQVSDMLEEYK